MRRLDEIATTLESFPGVVVALFGSVDDVVLRTRPEPGEWCPIEVVVHLIACDGPAFGDRIAAIADGEERLGGFDPHAAIDACKVDSVSIEGLLDEFRASRAAAAAFVRSLAPDTLDRTSSFGDQRRFAASDFLHEWPFHDQDHLQQIVAATKLAYVPHFGDDMRRALGLGADR
ncbi:MAG: DinB family protein [Actinomycetota bacterium]